jgi:CubicO group peptidase (beta-lactamase class C family)
VKPFFEVKTANLSDARVLRSLDGPLDQIDSAERPITFEDLLTHRAGLTYGTFHTGPLAKAYEQALGGSVRHRKVRWPVHSECPPASV